MTSPPRRRLSRLLAAAVSAAVAGSLLVGCDGGRSADLDTPAPARAGSESSDRAQLADEVVSDLETVLRRRAASAVDLSSLRDRASAELRTLARNARRLDLRDVSLRHLADSVTTLTDRQRDRWGDSAWVSDVQLSWRYAAVDREASVLTVPLVVEATDEGARFVTVGLSQAERLPLWLQGPVRVAKSPRAFVVTTPQHSPRTFLRLADEAAATVERTVPRWRGRLCVEVAADQATFREVAGIPQEQAAAVAAVTTTPDGVNTPGSSQHVYVNPELFDPLNPQGRAIVLAHEAAHVALGAAVIRLPLWLSEGIADYVALADTTLPVTKLAAQILELSRKRGVPRSLPDDERFSGSDRHIGAWYEASWLAVRLIATTYGEDAMWRFYRRSVRDGGTAAAFRDVLDTTRGDFVRRWREHLTQLAA